MAHTSNRRAYIDWVRGLSVLFMIEIHCFDAWTSLAQRKTIAYFCADFVGGLAAPLFMFLAGVSVVLAASARMRRGNDRAAAAVSVQHRGWEIFGLAFAFRLYTYVLSVGATVRGIFKSDILNVMGPAIAAAAWIWGRLKSRPARFVVFGLLTCACTCVTPWVRTLTWLDAVPFGWYIKPVQKLSVFTFFPWMGFAFAGAFVGEVQDGAGSPDDEWRMNRWFLLAGPALIAGGYFADYLPSIYPAGLSNFWTTSPTYFFVKTGIILVLVGLTYIYVQRPLSAEPRNPVSSPMLEFGRSSLFVYWIHVEIAYGFFSHPLHQRLGVWQSLVAVSVFSYLLYRAALTKNRLVEWWGQRRAEVRTA